MNAKLEIEEALKKAEFNFEKLSNNLRNAIDVTILKRELLMSLHIAKNTSAVPDKRIDNELCKTIDDLVQLSKMFPLEDLAK